MGSEDTSELAVAQARLQGRHTSWTIARERIGRASPSRDGCPSRKQAVTGVLSAEPIATPRQATLGVLRALFTRLHAEDVIYCHWKSNEHLRASMLGRTDLDLLFDRDCAGALSRILAELGFKRFSAVGARAYPGIEDYLGLDGDTGTLVHLHVHYRLTLGERYIKGYRLPWEETVLATRVFDRQEEIYVADPACEAVLLVTRMALKIRWRDYIASWTGRPYFVGGALRELRWLSRQLDSDLLAERARALVGDAAAQRLADVVFASVPSIRQLTDYRTSIDPSLVWRRTYGFAEGRARRWAREWRNIVAHRTGRRARGPSKRVSPRGGLFVAFVGADGAGKSTMTGEISRWLSEKLDVATIYGGSGAGSARWPRRVLQRLSRLARRFLKRPTVSAPAKASHNAADGHRDSRWRLRDLGRVLWALALDGERRSRLTVATRLTNLGMIVLADRYPQSQFGGFNDGPRLAAWLDGAPRLVRWAARRERATFRIAEASAPDVVIKLLVPYEVAAMRKPDTPPAQLRKKIEAVRALRYPSSTRIIEVDAAAPLPDVLCEVKRTVWDCL